MGKSKKMKGNRAGPNGPLERQIENSKFIKPKNRNKIRFRQAEDEEFVGANLSKKIISAARQQQMELGEEFGPTPAEADRQTVKLGNMDSDESEMEDNLEPDHFYEKIEINEEDEKALELFMNKDPAPRRTLADIIMDKITEKQTEIHSQFSESGLEPTSKLDPKVIQMYEGVRDVLKNYRSGKLPKAFKIIPKLSNWEEILNITDPMGWSAAGMYQGTRIFASNLKENMAQRYYNLVLLPRIRDDIAEYKRLNFHLYQALRKALFKPGAFMKGIILPLLESGTCTLREAIIIGSVVQRNSLPMHQSAAVLLKIAEMDYNGANSVFLRILFDKKYALPYRVVDAAVFHFLRFKTDTRELPVLWHQAFLTFVQRYKGDISSEQREALLELLRYQTHASITPEIRRELQNAKCRDIEIGEPMKTDTN